MKAPPNQYYMFLIDDFGLRRSYDELLQTVNFAVQNGEKLGEMASIIQLDAWAAHKCPRVERAPIDGSPASILARGLGGAGDGGLVVNNNGARILY